jgi:PIN domain nuclease of toxin-antitoxin system
MRLIHTNILLCQTIRTERLPKTLQQKLLNTTEAFAYSDGSVWEIAIKSLLGKSGIQIDPQRIEHGLNRQGFIQKNNRFKPHFQNDATAAAPYGSF